MLVEGDAFRRKLKAFAAVGNSRDIEIAVRADACGDDVLHTAAHQHCVLQVRSVRRKIQKDMASGIIISKGESLGI